MVIDALISSSSKLAKVIIEEVGKNQMPQPYWDDFDGLRIREDHLVVEDDNGFTVPFAGGQFSDFFEATYKGPQKQIIPERVTMKVWRGQNYEAADFQKAIVNAVKAWHKLKHENIVPLFGLCGPKMRAFPGIVVPYYSNGNILSYLANNRGVEILPLIVDILRGLSYVHSRGIVHGELKGSNVFIDDSGRARISDFGFTNQICDQVLSVPNTTAIYRWFAPELLASNGENGDCNELGSNVTPACDIYSFAMTAVEIYTLKQPFSHIRNHAVVILSVMNNDGRPQRPAEADAPQLTADMWEVINDCWAREAQKRPDTETVAQRVLALHMMSDSDRE